MTLSVVVIGRNEGDRLTRCLESIHAMTNPGGAVELIYVDSGSTDDSLQRAAGAGARTIALDLAHPTAAAGRNAGWRDASGEIILFLDGDTELAKDFVVNSLPEFDNAHTAVVWGHRREAHPEHSIYNRVLDLDWIYAPGLTAFCGGDALVRRATLYATGGFDETLIAGEEPELCRRILAGGQQIVHVDLAMTSHDLAITRLSQYWLRGTRAGHAFAEVSDRFRDSTNPFWSEEVRRNRNRALTLVALIVGGLAATMLRGGPWPAVAVVAMIAALSFRTAWKARWKSADPATLLLYGLHSHLQQIPIFFGQLQYRRNLRSGTATTLVEYK